MHVRSGFTLIVVVAGACASVTMACGGRLLDDGDATSTDATREPEVYSGEWCNYGDWQHLFDGGGGPTDAAATANDFCGHNEYLDVWNHCEFIIGGGTPWYCVPETYVDSCPNFVTEHDFYTPCCASETDCTGCCDGIHPGSWFRDH